ncbi:asparagine synthase (glutamine-hydrolyzing) [Kitasatospora sp. NPDC058162]|uniref:asparagine synthase (glutamine-hydrolyzing) n=1 Tax=Kitasatospora sp. NPDC058162 TaxID=3346362 RepID=UPI0036DBA209
MCGIVGYAHLNGGRPADRAVLERMAGTLVHRGPDSDGYFLADHVGMATRRLSIVDPATGDQPIATPDGDVTVCCNGEVFNHAELRARLKAAGHAFRTGGDVEVLVHLYEEHGTGLVQHLNGQFSFALYDRARRRLVLARDHVGITPLHYAVTGGTLVFGSEVKALLAHPLVRREVDPGGLDQVMLLPGLVSPRTMFAGIATLPPGHLLVVEDGRIDVRRYWDLDYPQAAELSPAAAAGDEERFGRLEQALRRSVELRMRADVPHAYYLSGGLDSSLVAGIAAKSAAERLRTFSVTFPDARMSEQPYQRMVARSLDSEHHEVPVTPDHLLDQLREVVRHSECPLKESYNVASVRLSAAVRARGAKVVLSGEGADELFAGYVGYKFDKQTAARATRSRRRTAAGRQPLTAEQRLNQRLWGNPLLSYGQRLGELAAARAELYSPELRSRLPDFDCLARPLVDLDQLRGRHVLHQRSYLDFKLRLADHLLGDHGDRVAMANSVEARYPFLDRDVIDCARALHPDLVLHGFQEKYPLKRIAERYVPSEIVNREKFAFHANPSADLLRADRSWIDDYLAPARIRREGYFDPAAVRELRARYAGREVGLNTLFEDDLLMVVVTHGIFLETFDLPALS